MYRLGCICLPCRAANAAYVQQRRGGVLYPNPCELVEAAYAEMHLTRLRGMGVGYRQAAKLAGVSERLVTDVRSGRKRLIQAVVATRILSVPAALAHGQTVMGWRSWRLLDSLQREGFTRTALARKLGLQAPKLALQRRRVRVRNALKVRTLYRKVTAEEPDGTARES